jgi:hypothetical protein
MRRGKPPFSALACTRASARIGSEPESSRNTNTKGDDMKLAQYAVKFPDAVDRGQ